MVTYISNNSHTSVILYYGNINLELLTKGLTQTLY